MVCCPKCHSLLRIEDPLRPPPWCPACGANLPRDLAFAPPPVAPGHEPPPPPESPAGLRPWLTAKPQPAYVVVEEPEPAPETASGPYRPWLREKPAADPAPDVSV